MAIEFEAKVLDVDPDALADEILRLGGRCVGERLMRRYVYDIAAEDRSRWVRLRDTGAVVTLAVKEIAHDGIDGTTRLRWRWLTSRRPMSCSGRWGSWRSRIRRIGG